MPLELETSAWSGEGTFTQLLLERLGDVAGVRFVRVEDAPATRSDADYNFISNELYVGFATVERQERIKRFGVLPGVRTVTDKALTLQGLEGALTGIADVGAPDYGDEGMLQYHPALSDPGLQAGRDGPDLRGRHPAALLMTGGVAADTDDVRIVASLSGFGRVNR
jgi:hypothetical protein